MSISRITAALVGTTVIAAVAVGCAPPTPTPTPASTVTVTATPTPTPTPTPTADASDPAGWVVTADGIGPVSLGEVLSDAATAMPTGTEIPEYCTWTAWWSAPDSSYQLVAATDGADESGAVTVVEASSPPDNTAVLGPRTAEGIGIGSTLDEVRAAYPDLVEVPEPTNDDGTPFDGGDGAPRYLRVQDAIIFTYYTGGDIVQAVTVTAQPVPPYEYCG